MGRINIQFFLQVDQNEFRLILHFKNNIFSYQKLTFLGYTLSTMIVYRYWTLIYSDDFNGLTDK